MTRRSIRNRRARRKINKEFDLQLTSMMDMLIILVVFLLKSYASNSVFVTSNSIKLPISTAEENPSDAISLVVEPSGISLDNERVIDFKLPPGLVVMQTPVASPPPNALTPENATYELEPRALADSGRRIVPLYDALVKARENTELLMNKAVWKDQQGNTTAPKFQGVLIIQADKAVRYELLRKVMYTAGAAEYKIFKLVAIKKETE
ncbi:MAG: biopolymer transporter ExbD [Bdellovibrionota bacterium]